MRRKHGERKMNVKVNQSSPKTNPNNKGMENFLNPTPSSNQAKTNSQQKINESQKTLTETKPTLPSQIEIKPQKQETKPTSSQEEIIKEIEEIEEKLNVKRNLDLSTFNQIIYNKKLSFKLLFIRQRIYVAVRDATGKSVVVTLNPPRWGGTSLRYLITTCAKDWCNVTLKTTSKGKVYSYVPVSANNVDDNIEDIFD
jgi:hypothetical protein